MWNCDKPTMGPLQKEFYTKTPNVRWFRHKDGLSCINHQAALQIDPDVFAMF